MTILFLLYSLLLIKALFFTYLYQIKEYRWDRLYSTIKETGWFHFLYNTQFRRPATSIRNVLIIALVLVQAIILADAFNEAVFIFAVLLSPVIAFILTSVAVYLTGFLARYQRRTIIEKAKLKATNSKAVCIGITGTYGKSSVKEFLYHVLSSQFPTAKTDKNMNTDVGIALSVINNLKDDTQYFVTEYGAYKVGEIEDACEIIRPAISVLTGLGNQHLDLYGSKENLVKAETYILNILDKNQMAYINKDFPHSSDAVKAVEAKRIFYSMGEADIHPTVTTNRNNKQQATIKYKKETFEIETSLLGRHNILNLLPAIAVAHDLGIEKTNIIKAVNAIQPIHGKLSIHHGFGGSTVINDSYNSVVNGFMAMIDVINDLPGKNKVIVSKGIIELGVEKRSSYRLILDKLAKTDIILYTTDHVFKEENKEAKILTLNDEHSILADLKKIAKQDTVIGIEGRFTNTFINTVII